VSVWRRLQDVRRQCDRLVRRARRTPAGTGAFKRFLAGAPDFRALEIERLCDPARTVDF
jgi:hypothetical protein